MFDLKKLFVDVFHPEAGERVVVVTDTPRPGLPDNVAWAERRAMAAEWHERLGAAGREEGFEVLPLVTYPAVGAHNADLPLDAGDPKPLSEALREATIVLALTEFSATAPMVAWSKSQADFRAATLPGVARRMEGTALAADYAEVARRCERLAEVMRPAILARVTFSSGHGWEVDLRHREVRTDDGQLPRSKKAGRVINLPGGETFQVPYEGERPGDPSRTQGEVPIGVDGASVVLSIEANRIVEVRGRGSEADRLRALFDEDPARGNVAEIAIGCNPMAVVWGSVLEDEKAGFHWAYGRSEHLGGTMGPGRFRSPSTIVHQDVVYARDSPVGVDRLSFVDAQGGEEAVIAEGRDLLFGGDRG